VPASGDYDGEIGEMLSKETEVLGENLTHCRFAHHNPHMLAGPETEPPRWKASD
jgi:hypothetical protein